MEIQAALGAEIVMAFDECPPGDAGHEKTRESMELTLRWAERSKTRFFELQEAGMDTGRKDAEGLAEFRSRVISAWNDILNRHSSESQIRAEAVNGSIVLSGSARRVRRVSGRSS